MKTHHASIKSNQQMKDCEYDGWIHKPALILFFLLFEKDFNPSFMDGSSRNKNDSVILDEKRPDIC